MPGGGESEGALSSLLSRLGFGSAPAKASSAGAAGAAPQRRSSPAVSPVAEPVARRGDKLPPVKTGAPPLLASAPKPAAKARLPHPALARLPQPPPAARRCARLGMSSRQRVPAALRPHAR